MRNNHPLASAMRVQGDGSPRLLPPEVGLPLPGSIYSLFFFFLIVFIYLFLALLILLLQWLSIVGARGGHCLAVVQGLLMRRLLSFWSLGSRARRLQQMRHVVSVVEAPGL